MISHLDTNSMCPEETLGSRDLKWGKAIPTWDSFRNGAEGCKYP